MASYPFSVQRNVMIFCFVIHKFIRRCNIYDQLFFECDKNTMFVKQEEDDDDDIAIQWGE